MYLRSKRLVSRINDLFNKNDRKNNGHKVFISHFKITKYTNKIIIKKKQISSVVPSAVLSSKENWQKVKKAVFTLV